MSEILGNTIDNLAPRPRTSIPVPESLRTSSSDTSAAAAAAATDDDNNNSTTNNRSARKCGYCRKEGHTVRHCQDIFKSRATSRLLSYY